MTPLLLSLVFGAFPGIANPIAPPPDNPKIKALVEAQEKVGYRDHLALVRENVRAERVLKTMMDADELRTANDFLVASGLIDNAPGYEAKLLEHEWAVSALVLGHPDAPKRARLTWDSLQLASGRPQRFGTFTRRNAEGQSAPRATDPTLADMAPATGADDPELKALKDADQADRTGAEGMEERDAVRRARVLAILKAGRATTGADAYHAALVFQHGDGYGDFMLAHELCLSALARGYGEAAWLVSRTYDRMLEHGGRAQRFATQMRQNRVDSPAFIIEGDYPGPSDATRKLLKAITRAETRAKLDAWRRSVK